jgi:hypothetical protein
MENFCPKCHESSRQNVLIPNPMCTHLRYQEWEEWEEWEEGEEWEEWEEGEERNFERYFQIWG